MKERNFKTLMNRLARAGFKKDFVRSAILPDWWDDHCAGDINLLQDVEIRVARFLGLPLAVVKGEGGVLLPEKYPGARLRGAKVTDRSRLVPAIYSAIQIASAVIRNLNADVPYPDPPPTDGLAWRNLIGRPGSQITLNDIAADLWRRGIPVVPLDVLPSPSFQGMACVADGRPAALIGYKHDEPGRIAFILAHEAGHVAAGDCTPAQPIVDVDEGTDITNHGDIEFLADQYAIRMVIGSDAIPNIDGIDFRELARQASRIERATGADATAMIFGWARRNKNYKEATKAIKALYRATGARSILYQLLKKHVDFTTASESDRALLQCAFNGLEADEASL